MRQTCIFSGSSHPTLVDTICNRLGQKPADVELKKFANGETSVEMKTSVRDQDVFIVQSGSSEVNDNVMEMLIMISACKGGSARSITAVMPYFPYSRQSKKKQHRGAITARMIANLMNVAGVDHVITIDLHASQMQGFFKCPVDNLVAEPLLAKWIRLNIHEWWDAVVVSKNPGGTKRVTSLADALKLSFGIVTTERRRPTYPSSMYNSVVFESLDTDGANDRMIDDEDADAKYYTAEPEPAMEVETKTNSDVKLQAEAKQQSDSQAPIEHDFAPGSTTEPRQGMDRREFSSPRPGKGSRATTSIDARTRARMTSDAKPSPLAKESRPESHEGSESSRPTSIKNLHKIQTAVGFTNPNPKVDDDDGYEEPSNDQFDDERARDVVTGRLIHGHIVDDDAPSPTISAMSASMHGQHGHRHSSEEDLPDNMINSFMSTASSRAPRNNGQGLGGTGDANASDEEEEEALKDPEVENTITLVGNVRDKPVFIVDDMIDKAGSWIAAAETVVKRGGATKVICMATHGLFGGECLQELENCDEIDCVVVTNAFPIPAEKKRGVRKLVELDVSGLLSEAIRRNHHGESISQLYQAYD